MSFEIKGRKFGGGGRPLVCASLAAETAAGVAEAAEAVASAVFPPDIVEWRADAYSGGDYLNALGVINEKLSGYPVIFTLRSHIEGGLFDVPDNIRAGVFKEVINTGRIDLIDVEFSSPFHNEVMELARGRGIRAIVSHHDFSATPDKHGILSKLTEIAGTGCDVVKAAYMPQSRNDVVSLLSACAEFNEIRPELPVIAVSMGGFGRPSRVACGLFGSAVTFGAHKISSAPGQPHFARLAEIVGELY